MFYIYIFSEYCMFKVHYVVLYLHMYGIAYADVHSLERCQ